ncbi:hypothetical protein [Alkalimonas amylolytica]|uniref:Uncharacterized protein n=1 Tax=Alkalimonas amylolytica TaxID=152573 RepID=A0A1H4G3X2_ALKAM|nr:hypothetical protein [Alkalimonas amylolytica]SEB04326.1 hypothetical protein SAMN04488051_11819 [Alkalimonas amylolytica]
MIALRDFTTALYALGKAKGYATTVIVTPGTLIAAFNLNYTYWQRLCPVRMKNG